MAKYIDREALVSIFNAKADMAIGTPKEVFHAAAKMVELLPAADVVEVRRGEWSRSDEFDEQYGYLYKCSCCGRLCWVNNYCSYCGAKMDGERRKKDGREQDQR
jgi:hypothetical protein